MATSSTGSISSPGLGSGIDINGLIAKLMTAEQQPLTRLNTKEAGAQIKITALGTLKSAVSSLNSAAASLATTTGQEAATKFATYKATLADTAIASATATSSATLGSYSLEVTQLAKTHRLSTTVGAFAASTDEVTQGTLAIALGDGTTHDVVIDETNNTLAGLKDAINDANAGVTASIVKVSDTDVRLVIASKTEGLDGKMTLTGLSGFQYDPDNAVEDLSQAEADGGQAAQGAQIKLNGVTIDSDTNTVSDVIDGVTLTLTKETTSATTLTVSRDTSSALTTTLTALVKAYNEYAKSVKDLGKYDESSKTSGPLLGNATLRQVSNLIGNTFQGVPSGLANVSFRRLSDIGVQLQKDGTLALSSSKLTSAIGSNYEEVAELAAAFGSSLDSITDGMLGTSGTITAATDGLNRTITDISRQRLAIQEHLEKVEQNYRTQFNAMDKLVASMNSTSSYLQQQLSSLANLSKSTST